MTLHQINRDEYYVIRNGHEVGFVWRTQRGTWTGQAHQNRARKGGFATAHDAGNGVLSGFKA